MAVGQAATGRAFVTLAGLLAGLHIVINKIGLAGGLHPLTFAAFKPIISIVVIVTIFQRRVAAELPLLRAELKPLLLMGVVGYGVAPITLFYGQNLTSATNSAFLLQTEPLFVVALAALIFEERIGRQGVASTLLLLLGAYLITTGGVRIVPRLGDSLILLTALLFGVGDVVAKIPLRRLSASTTALLGYTFGGAFLIAVWGFASPSATPSPHEWLWIALSSLTITFCTIFLYEGIRRIGVSRSILLVYLITPLSAAVLARIALGESMTGVQMLGAALLLCGVALMASMRQEDK
ncbi:MAG: Permease of the drug/metabolite transportersuperfamily [Candidatus Alkanophagales archaeon MCA70_species_1]|nr:Permease of the drug/metabolite transportersuperfamily [Candidatus Alkanophaga volatiphilum]